MKKMAASLLLAFWVGSALARGAVALVEPDRVTLFSEQVSGTPDLVREAIMRASAEKAWKLISEEPGKLQLKYEKENHEVVVEVSYDEASFQIRYVSSTNMKYASRRGIPTIRPAYNTWIENLSRAISSAANNTSTNK